MIIHVTIYVHSYLQYDTFKWSESASTSQIKQLMIQLHELAKVHTVFYQLIAPPHIVAALR